MSELQSVSQSHRRPSALDAFVARITRKGARPQPLAELQTRVPNLGPITLQGSGQFDIKVYPGPLMRFVPVQSTGRKVNLTA